MTEARKIANGSRWVGALLIAQITGLIGAFILLHPVTVSDYLQTLGQAESQVHWALLWLILNAGVAFLISIVGWPMFKKSGSIGVALVGVGIMVLLCQALDNAHIFTLLSLSKDYTAAAPSSKEMIEIVAAAERETRGWVHRAELVTIDLWIALLYGVLLKLQLAPRWLWWAGLATVGCHFLAIVLPLIIGRPGFAPLGSIMALTHLATGIWFLTKGPSALAPDSVTQTD